MKKYFIISILLTSILYVNLATAKEISHKVIKVIDGDTVYVDFNNNGIPEQNEKVRIIFVIFICPNPSMKCAYRNTTQEFINLW